MTPPKLLTVDEIIELKKSYVLFGDVGDDLETLLETALAAMRVVEAAQGVAIAKYGYSVPVNGSIESAQKSFEYVNRMLEPLNEALKPFQQTGDDKK